MNALEHLTFILSRRIEETGGSEELLSMVRELLSAAIALPEEEGNSEPLLALNVDWTQRYLPPVVDYPALYVILAGNTGYHKIGKSNVPPNRVRDLQTGNHEQLVIVHIEHGEDEGEAERLEGRVHDILDQYRSPFSREWFNVTLDQAKAAIAQARTEEVQALYGALYVAPSV
ncbi:GIY-YIG nuclease family protein [Bradyrhizobium sp. SRL28]|uniref:GIY-YIG nuclease family protein n=1 Tax=Bradyrhizobium sp. SRL28 TaxID=2836178 RepID=UPI001BDE1CAF|nr:GIY-YIG nuclease family protein [Bradyrhizobium sp. SRL28]MBT1509348.1 GIY-YIG nuclease family protein [Bradyrhizobium sp. SRL28]